MAGVRRGTGERRVGHAGTLDPLAEGVLVLALGQATRLVEYMVDSTKCYQAEITLGLSTDTYDMQGQVVSQREVPLGLDAAQMEDVLGRFRGEIDQVPPVYSAIKVKGKSAHTRVRAGEDITLAPRRVTIHDLSLLAFEPPRIDLSIRCSAGTYIRSLAHDIGEVLGCGAVLAHLVRTQSGSFRLEEAIAWDRLQASFLTGAWGAHLLPADAGMRDWPLVRLDETAMGRLRHGKSIDAPDGCSGWGRAYSPQGELVAVLESELSGTAWHPKKVLIEL